MKETKAYVPISDFGRFTHIRIDVDYYLGGINYFYGTETKRGVYFYIRPVELGHGMEGCTLLGDPKECGFKILLKELGRKSQKTTDAMWSKIEPLKDILADKFVSHDFSDIREMVLATIE